MITYAKLIIKVYSIVYIYYFYSIDLILNYINKAFIFQFYSKFNVKIFNFSIS